ncbi:phosphotransferase [Candidatus Gracilibacteria bacterium]|nr:phosphotransferase [Candidatus Gracilibacteria bacterium]
MSDETVHIVLDIIAPGSSLLRIDPLRGANITHLVTARSANNTVFRIVIHRYAVFGTYDRGAKARREYTTLDLLRRHAIPAPKPLYLDTTGTVLGTPGIITQYVSGVHIDAPVDAVQWARERARILAHIHSVPCDEPTRSLLLDANSEVIWFLASGAVPTYMTAIRMATWFGT